MQLWQYCVLVVVNKHNTARVASCWFIMTTYDSRKFKYKKKNLEKLKISLNFFLKFRLLGMIVGATGLHALLATEVL